MQPIHPVWNWLLLLLLGVSSYATVTAFGFHPIFFLTPAPESTPAVYPWTSGLIFSATTAVIFLLCLRDARERRAALAAFGISALLTGPLYILNARCLAQFAPASSPWPVPHLPMGLMVLSWGLSAGLLIWWLFRSGPVARQGSIPALLFGGLLLVLLVIPGLTNRCGIESLYFFAILPAKADAVRDNQAALTHLLIYGFAGSLGDMCGFMAQWIGLTTTILTVLVVAIAVVAGRRDSPPDRKERAPFPNRNDLIPLLLLAVGGVGFVTIAWPMGNLQTDMDEVSQTVHRSFYTYCVGILSVESLVASFFLLGLWLVFKRIRDASQIRFGFTILILILSAAFSMLSLLGPPYVMGFSLLASILCLAQVFTFFRSERRAVWASSAFAAPGETALSFAVQGALMLAILASGLMAIALELAYVSVMAIHYLIDWGTALKLPHGVAPTKEIAPAFGPSLACITVELGPVYFSACLFFGVTMALLFSLVYGGCQGCGKLFRRRAEIKRYINAISPDIYPDRRARET